MRKPALRGKLVLATKVCAPMDSGDVNARGLSRHHIMDAVDKSLARLQTNYIDLYQASHACMIGFSSFDF